MFKAILPDGKVIYSDKREYIIRDVRKHGYTVFNPDVKVYEFDTPVLLTTLELREIFNEMSNHKCRL